MALNNNHSLTPLSYIVSVKSVHLSFLLVRYLSHLITITHISGVRVTRSLVLCVCFVDHCLSLCLFVFAIVLSVLLRFTDSDYTFGIFKLYLCHRQIAIDHLHFSDLILKLYVFIRVISL